MKRWIAGILFAALVTVLISACSGGAKNDGTVNDGTVNHAEKPVSEETGQASETPEIPNLNLEGFPVVNEPIQLTMMGNRAANDGPWEDMFMFTHMEEQSNIILQMDTPPAGSFAERKNLVFASGDYPDFFFGNAVITAKDEALYGKQGILIPLEELIETYAPNIKAALDSHPDYRGSITSADGHIYSLPNIQSFEALGKTGPKLWPNTEMLGTMGIADLPETTEQLYDVLTRIKAADPEKIPLSAANINDLRSVILPAFGHIGGVAVEERDGKVMFVPAQENFKHYLEFLNRLYREKLLDNQIFAQNSQQFTAKGKDGHLGFAVVFAPFQIYNVTAAELVEQQYPVVPILTSEVNTNKIWKYNHSINPGYAAITDKNKYPEATIRWLDHFFTTQGVLLLTGGFAVDEQWLSNPDNKVDTYSNLPDGVENQFEYLRQHITPQAGPRFDSQQRIDRNPQSADWLYLTNQSVEVFVEHARPAFPLVQFTIEEMDRISILTTDITTYVQEMEAKFITGSEDFSKWDDYINTLNNMNIEELIEIHQKAYDRFKALSD